jgi:hypothetical protein
MSSSPARKPPYLLMPHAYICAREDYVVLMDIELGKYLAIDGRQSRHLSELIEGWPNTETRSPLQGRATTPQSRSAERIVQQLLHRKLLTEDPTIGKKAAPTQALPPLKTFPIFTLERSLRPHLHYLPNFLRACLRANRLSTNIRLANVVDRIQARRRRWGPLVPDMQKLERLVRAHHHLRPLIYSWNDRCLYDSIVLLEFLALHRVDATWVFGVHTWPWIPHCWVRAGSYLLNDTPTNTGAHSILAEF